MYDFEILLTINRVCSKYYLCSDLIKIIKQYIFSKRIYLSDIFKHYVKWSKSYYFVPKKDLYKTIIQMTFYKKNRKVTKKNIPTQELILVYKYKKKIILKELGRNGRRNSLLCAKPFIDDDYYNLLLYQINYLFHFNEMVWLSHKSLRFLQ